MGLWVVVGLWCWVQGGEVVGLWVVVGLPVVEEEGGGEVGGARWWGCR